MKAYQMKIAIKNSHPPIWRRFIVPAGLSFSQLGIVLNEVMGWCGYHLDAFEFYHLGLRLEEETEDMDIPWGEYDIDDASQCMIEPYLDSEEWFTYIYDFGDNWEHRVTVEKTIPDYEYNYPMVLKFKGETPYEDCGGIWRYYDLLDILQDPSHPEYEKMKEWTEMHFTRKYDMDDVNQRLKKMYLSGQKSKPMTQNEIYEAMLKRDEPFKQIQGIREIPTKYNEDEDAWDEEDFGLALDELREAFVGFAENMKEMQIQNMEKTPEDMRLFDILKHYTKEDLVGIFKIHHLNGYSKYRKKELAEFTVREILSDSVMRRYFIYLEDEELEILDKGERKAGGCVQEWPCDYAYLLEGGYCGGLYAGSCLIPREVWEAYRKNCDAGWKAEREEKRTLLDYMNAMVQLNGCCSLEDVMRIYEKETGIRKETWEAWNQYIETPESKLCFHLNEDELVLMGMEDEEILQDLRREHRNKGLYCPTLQEVKTLSRKGFLPFDRHMQKLAAFLMNSLGELKEDANLICRDIQCVLRIGGSVEEIMEYMEDVLDMDQKERQRFLMLVQNVRKHTRMIANRGYTPEEMGINGKQDRKESRDQNAEKIISFPGSKKKKIYPNDPCPCGSGRKYKNCCGKKK